MKNTLTLHKKRIFFEVQKQNKQNLVVLNVLDACHE